MWKKEISVDHFKSPNISISLKKSFWAGSTKYSVKFSKNGMNDFDLIHCLVSASIHLFHFHITTVFTSFNLILLSLLRLSCASQHFSILDPCFSTHCSAFQTSIHATLLLLIPSPPPSRESLSRPQSAIC